MFMKSRRFKFGLDQRIFPIVRLLTLIPFIALTVEARTDLSDTIGDQRFTREGNPYVVHKPLVIPKGKTVVFKEGCRVFFGRGSGIQVEGNLVVEGTEEQPVRFSSTNDFFSPEIDTLPPGPSDWDGITISRKAGEASLKYFTITYSTYGIRAYRTIVIEKGIFIDNGTCNVMVNDSIELVSDSVPYSYMPGMVTSEKNHTDSVIIPFDTLLNSALPTDATTRIAAIPPEREAPFIRTGIPVIVGAAGAGLGAVSVWSMVKYFSGGREYQSTKDEARLEYLKKKGFKYSTISISTGMVSILTVAGSVVMYLWNHTRWGEVDYIQITPVRIDGSAGTAVTVLW